jgi:hypothetical protein
MRQKLAFVVALLAWASIFIQFFLMIENRTASIQETVVRFFSFFTILTNTLVAVYFSIQLFSDKPVNGLTPVTIYITIVGLVYQILLRHTWNPQGVQKVVDEMLHSVIPLLTIVYWWLYRIKGNINYRLIITWAIYPLVYLFYILIRGHYAGFYPYPFVDVATIGMNSVLVNAGFILIGFILISALFVRIARIK